MLEKHHILKSDEIELVKRCVNNDRHAQNLLFKIYSKKMMAICFRYTKSREDAEDVLNDGFMRVFEKINTYQGIGSLEGWIRKVIVNVAIEKFRRGTQMYKHVDIETINISHQSSSDIYGELNAKELIIQIQKLPPAYQMVFNLYVFEGLKHREIAEQLGISEGTSKSNLSNARTWLKKRIEILSIEKKAI
ncbi:MAG: polymerase sigma factor, sigma-70 family [Bacteroidetes bacterium]|nr:polymerase sigma factor, sigma-70 family [Bacteroidota bacterium]